jgi:hypothetical protein
VASRSEATFAPAPSPAARHFHTRHIAEVSLLIYARAGVSPSLKTAHRLTPIIIALAAVSVGGCSQIDDRPAEWGYISPAIFQPNCATTSCHSPAAAVSGLDFSTPQNGYASLTGLYLTPIDGGAPAPGTPCVTENGIYFCQKRPLVTPYDPDGSRLVNMLLARDAPRMPPDRPLPMPDIELVERWILNGAFEYPNGAAVVDAGRGDAVDAKPSDAANRSDARNGSDAARDREPD